MSNSPRPAEASHPVRPDDVPHAVARTAPPLPAVPEPRRRAPRPALRRLLVPVLVLSLIWSLLTDWRLDAWIFGLPAVLLGAWLLVLLPGGPGWRIAPGAALRFALWFTVQAVRGAVDVSRRAVSPRMPLDPGFRTWRVRLPEGAPRLVLANAVSLLPGTLSAELEGERLTIHLLDCGTDLEADLTDLEARIAALFALSIRKELAA